MPLIAHTYACMYVSVFIQLIDKKSKWNRNYEKFLVYGRDFSIGVFGSRCVAAYKKVLKKEMRRLLLLAVGCWLWALCGTMKWRAACGMWLVECRLFEVNSIKMKQHKRSQ